MADGETALAEGFPPADEAAWRALVDKTLDGQDFDKRLVSRTADGLKVQPLYTAANAGEPLAGAGGGVRADGRWDIRVRIDHPDLVQANAIALEALEGGASSILLALDPTGEHGVAVGSKADLERVLEGVLIDLAPVGLDAPTLGAVGGAWLADIGEARTLRPKLALHLDPLSGFAATGSSVIEAEIATAAALAARGVGDNAFLASGVVVHEAGGTEAMELGFALASALAYAKAGEAAGLERTAAFRAIVLGLAVDGEYFTSISKLRAARALWARLTEAATGAPVPAVIEARSSRRMLAALDPWANMLRLTAAGFGAAVGGADAIVLDPFSQPLGRPTAFARRQARNAQLVLMEESALGRVADPAAGAWYVEDLSRNLATAAWAFLQKIEAEGGAAKALESGLIADAVVKARSEREAAVAKRRSGLIGVSEFPDLAEAGVELDHVDPAAFPKPSPVAAPTGPASHCPRPEPWRASAPFERLRARAAALRERPTAFLATLGAPADYAGRVGFTRNLLAAGGIAAEVGAVSDYAPSIGPLAVICGSDALYAEGAAEAARALKAAGAKVVALAGRPGELEAALTEAGVADFLHVGMDAPAYLDHALILWEGL